MKWWNRLKGRPALIKLLNWEYWPSKAFYYPMTPYLWWLMLKARHICFWSAANPGIYTGGMGLESKYQTLLKIPEPYRPQSILIKKGTPLETIEAELQRVGIQYPFIAKPDLGFRGLLVKKINNATELSNYLHRYPIDFILQELILLPEEIGVLYYRLPGQETGHISSITTKEFLFVEGDGSATVEQLIRQKPRAVLQLERIRRAMPEVLRSTPNAGQIVNLGIVGNHAKGTRFINSNDRISPEIVRTFDQLSKQIEGLYYGRFDLKCTSFDALRTGEGIKVIEVNGVCSEPTHIYDPARGTYFSAIRDIIQHWSIIYRIARANHREGIPYESTRVIAREFLHLFAYQKRIKDYERGGPYGTI